MFKLLITSDFYSQNSYVKNIATPLMNSCEMVCDVSSFWSSSLRFDIVHIQWPEELFHWQPISHDDITRLKTRLDYWKSKGVKLVATRHNTLPHGGGKYDAELYKLVYSISNAIIHLGDFSHKNLKINHSENIVIPHVNYHNLYEDINQQKARKKIGFPEKGRVFLSFGIIRDINEEQQIIKAFQAIKSKEDYLYICNSKLFRKKPSFLKKPIQRLNYHLSKRVFKFKNVFFFRKRIHNKDLKYFFNAADVIISPRMETLNSGVVFMGFSFSKIVIGPNVGNVGGILKILKNPVFEPNNLDSIKAAFIAGKSEINSPLGKNNFDYSKANFSSEKIAKHHLSLYKSLLNL